MSSSTLIKSTSVLHRTMWDAYCEQGELAVSYVLFPMPLTPEI